MGDTMNRKAVNYELVNERITCPSCKGYDFVEGKKLTIKNIEKFMSRHSKCVEFESFEVLTVLYPIYETNCEFCNAEGGEERYGVYVCASCEYTLHKVKFTEE